MSTTQSNRHARNEQKVSDAMSVFLSENNLANAKTLAIALRNAYHGYWWGQQGKYDLEKMAKSSRDSAKYFLVCGERFEAAKAYNFASIALGYLGKNAESLKVLKWASKDLETAKKNGEDSIALEKEMIKNTLYFSINSAVMGNHKESLRYCVAGLHKAVRMGSKYSLNDSEKKAFKRYEAIFLRGIGIVLLHLKRPQKGLKYFHRSMDAFSSVKDKKGLAKTWKEAGHAYLALNRFNDAIKALEESRALYTETGHKDCWVHFHLGCALDKINKRGEADSEFEKAIHLVETDRTELEEDDNRISYFAQKLMIYDGAIDHFGEQGEVEKAYQIVQKCKARVFLEIYRQIHFENPGGTGLSVGKDVATPNQIRSSLEEDEAIVDYYLGKQSSWIFLVIKNSIIAKQIPASVSQLSSEVSAFYGFLRQVQHTETHKVLDWHLRRLHNILVDPIWDELKPYKKLIFVPNRDLFLLPFGALKTPEGRYLIEDTIVTYLPSASTLPLRGRANRSVKFEDLRFLALANPLGDLHHAEKEVRGVSGLFSNKDIFTGELATKSALLNAIGHKDRKILHLACHGEMLPEDPLGGRLLLSRNKDGDGSLVLTDIFNLKLKNLVLAFLSGCYTGRGRMEAGDEVLGLSRTFLAAGAGSVIVTLWDVEDSVTSTLVQEFYRNASTGISFAESLRNAQVSTLKTRPHPYFWSAFQSVG